MYIHIYVCMYKYISIYITRDDSIVAVIGKVLTPPACLAC